MAMIGALIMGALVGWIAGKLMGVEGGLLRNIVIGVVGSFVGSCWAFTPTDFWRRFSPAWWAPACSFGWDADCCTEWKLPKTKGGPFGPPFFAVTAF